jgi:outer membrane protein TolC
MGGPLAALILLALERNPDIQAAAETAQSMAARVPQVTALPDPVLSTKVLPEPVRTAEGDNYFVLGVRQTFPFPEKLDRRGRMALERAREAIAKLEQQRLRVVAEIKRAYFQLYVVDRTAQVIRDNQDLLRGLIDVARGQLVAGRRSQQDVLRAQVAFSELESQLVKLRQRRGVIEARMNRLLSRSVTTAVPSAGEIGIRDFEVTLERLLTHARQENPRLAELRYMIERERHGVRLARLAYWPDLTVGFEWMSMTRREAFQPPINLETGRRPPVSKLSEEGSDNWAITASLNLPIWFQKIEGGIREARHRLSAARQQYQAGRDEVDYQVEDALVSVQAQRDLAEIFGGTIVPQAKQAYDVSLADYTAGTEDFQAAIDNWRRWLTFTIQYHRAVGELERSVADLEEALGMAIVNVASDSTSGAPTTESASERTQPAGDVSPAERIDGAS